nr:MAG TPA: hypothetical protein [Caudoviricetes sp.]
MIDFYKRIFCRIQRIIYYPCHQHDWNMRLPDGGEDFGSIPKWRCNLIIQFQRIFNILFVLSADW